jgi:U3 small nucleolar RNA-associated protein 23
MTPQAEEHSLHATDKDGAPPPMSEPLKKKRAPKGPNPLSMKKKVVANVSIPVTTAEKPATAGVKRKRDTSDDEASDGDNITADVPKKRKRKRKHKSSLHA